MSDITIGTRVLVTCEDEPWYEGHVVGVTADGNYAKVREAGFWFWPDDT